MDERTRDLIDYAILWVSFGLLVLAIVGEVLGWWGELGIVLTVASLVGTVYAAVDIYGRRGVSGIERVIDGLGGLQRTQTQMVHHQEAMLDNQNAMLENQGTMVGNQAAMLQSQEASTVRLDRIQETLDRRLPDGA